MNFTTAKTAVRKSEAAIPAVEGDFYKPTF
jgi:hypothetical protein